MSVKQKTENSKALHFVVECAMSTTVTETKTRARANSLSLRSEQHDSDEDTKSQESYSTVVEATTSHTAGATPSQHVDPNNEQQATKQTESHSSKEKREASANKQHDSDTDEEDPSPCGRCRKLVVRGDEALTCDICSQWFHTKCERVTKAQYKQLAAKGKSNLHWFCDTCNILQTGVIRQVAILNAEQSKFKQRLDDLEKKAADKKEVQKELEKKADKEDMQKLEQRVTTLEEKAEKENTQDSENPGPSTSSGGGNTMDQVIKEMKDQDDRKNNIIFFNIAESKSKDMNERTKHDKEEVKEITKICSATIKKDDMLRAIRLGKKPNEDKPRPLLIEVSSDDKKKALFKNLSKLQNAPEKYQAVSVQNDLTKKQREQEKNLREEAKKKEEEASGEAKFKVRGPPWDRKIVKFPIKKSN